MRVGKVLKWSGGTLAVLVHLLDKLAKAQSCSPPAACRSVSSKLRSTLGARGSRRSRNGDCEFL
jgi:hypothetical protein